MALSMSTPLSTPPPPHITSLEPKLLQTIALLAEDDPSRPPEATRALRLTCRTLANALRPADNRRRRVRLFKLKFDFAPLRRRLGTHAHDPDHISAEFSRREKALHSIRRGQLCEGDTLLVAYVMLLEDEGKNLAQLTIAGLRTALLLHVAQQRFDSIARGWPSAGATNALVAAVCWQLYVATQDEALIEHAITDLLMPFAVGTSRVQYPMFHLGLDFGDVPLHEIARDPREVEARQGTFLVREYFGRRFVLRVPPIALSATLLFMKRMETNTLDLPDDHPEYPLQVAMRRPYRFTKAHIDNFNGERHRPHPARSPKGPRSLAYDADWQRLTPFFGRHPGFIYRPGTLAGEWKGCIRSQHSGSYESLQDGGGWDASSGAVAEFNADSSCRPWMCALDVHYRVVERSPHASPVEEAETFCRRWLPPTCSWREHEDGVVVVSEQAPYTSFYRTFAEGQPDDVLETLLSSYGPDTSAEGRVKSLDIVLTGKMKEFVGNGWTESSLFGSVRPRDGLIALRRTPVRGSCKGYKNLFVGYLVSSREMAGRQRQSVEVPLYEDLWNLSRI